MSNFLTNVKIGNLQTELDVLSAYTHEQVFAGGLKNPLGSDMLCLNPESGLRYGIQGASVINCVGTVTTNNLAVSGAFTPNNVIASGTVSGSILSAASSANTPTLNVGAIFEKNPGNGIGVGSNLTVDASHSFTSQGTANLNIVNIGGITTSQSDIICKGLSWGDDLTAQGTTLHTDNISCYTGSQLTIGNDITMPSNQIFTTGVTVNNLKVNTIGVDTNSVITVSNDLTLQGSTVLTVPQLTATTASLPSINGGTGQSITITDQVTMTPGNSLKINEALYVNNIANLDYPTKSFITVDCDLAVGINNSVIVNNILDIGQAQFRPSGSTTRSSDVVLTSADTPGYSLGALKVMVPSVGLYGLVYDSVYNVPPGVTATTLEAVLTAGNSAPTKSMTVETVTSVTSSQNYLKLPDAIAGGDSIFLNNQNGILSIGDVLAPGTTPPVPLPGQVYDTYYNKPPQTFGGAITDSGGITLQRTVAHFYPQYSSNNYAWAPLFQLSQSQNTFNNMTTTFDSIILNTNRDGPQLVQTKCYLYLTSDLRAYPEIILPQQPNPTMISCNYNILDFTVDPSGNVNIVLPFLNTIVDTPYTSPTVYIVLAVPYTTETIFDPAGYTVLYNYQGGFLSIQQDQKVAVTITPYNI
jgi:hypothetical protein